MASGWGHGDGEAEGAVLWGTGDEFDALEVAVGGVASEGRLRGVGESPFAGLGGVGDEESGVSVGECDGVVGGVEGGLLEGVGAPDDLCAWRESGEFVDDVEVSVGVEDDGADGLGADVGVDGCEVEDGGSAFGGLGDGEDVDVSADELEVVVDDEGIMTEVIESE